LELFLCSAANFILGVQGARESCRELGGSNFTSG
jgi:hypothetical protein